MRILIALLALAFSVSAVASTKETKTFFYDGSTNSVELSFYGEKTHTEYRTERRSTICYRQAYAGMRTTCTGGGNSPRYCTQHPVYHTVPYTCYETVSVPYQVHDYYVDARVIVDVTNATGLPTTGETIKVTLEGDYLSFSALGSKKYFLVTKHKDVQTGFNGNTKMIDGVIAVELVEAAPLLSAVKMDSLSVVNDALRFSTNKMENIGLSLAVEQKKVFGDELIFSRSLTDEEVTVNGDQAEVRFLRLGFELGKGKYEFTAKAEVKFEGEILNRSQFSNLSASKTLVYRVK